MNNQLLLDLLNAKLPKLDYNKNYDPKKAKDFLEHCDVVDNWIQKAKNEYLSTLKLKNVFEMAIFFAIMNKEAGSVCAKEMTKVGGWRCNDCVKNETTVFCQECWAGMKDKHQGHNILFTISVDGTCDCGDPNAIEPSLFCPKHKGPMTNEFQINTYLNSSLGAPLVGSIRKINKGVFDQMGTFVIRAMKENREEDPDFIDILNEFIEFFSYPCQESKPILHIVTDLLLINYPFKTKHICINLKGNQPKLAKSSVFSHDCCCPFIRLLLLYWPMGKDKVIYSFLHNYKLRKAIGFCYLLLYGEFIKNCMMDIKELSVQLLTEELSNEAIKMNGLVENVYNCMPQIYKYFLRTSNNEIIDKAKKIPLFKAISLLIKEFKEVNKFNIMKGIVLRLKFDTLYLVKSKTLKYFGNNSTIYLKLIDLLAILHNINIFISNGFSSRFSQYIIQLLDIELWTLDIFAFYVSILNFDNDNLVKEIFSYFSKKINKKKRIIGKNEYTFHLALFRGFSIFLNRYCFNYAHKHKTDITKGLESALKIFPNFQGSFKVMLEAIYKVFGFITACGESFFETYYSKNMVEYEYLYYYNKQFIYRDFCLLKYIMALKQFKDYFNIDVILSLSQVNDSNLAFEKNILKGTKMVPPSQWLSGNERNLRMTAKILRIILNVLRNNTCLIWNLGSAQLMLTTNKIKDQLIIDIINNDSQNFNEIVKELIVNQTCIKENLALYTDIYDSIFLCLKEVFGKNKVSETILSMTNKTLTQEKKANFSIKDEYLEYLDLNYILYPSHKSAIEKYIQDFKKNIVSIFNVHFYPVNKYEAKLTNEDYKQIYFNEQNFDFFFRFTAFIIQRDEFKSLNQYFIQVLLNYLGTFFCLDSDQFLFFRETINNKIVDLVKILEQNKLEDDMQKTYCLFIIEKIRENNDLDPYSKKNENEFLPASKPKPKPKNIVKEEPKKVLNVQPVKNDNKISMKDRMKNKFKKKNDNLGNKFGLDKIKLEKKKNTESCIYCLKPIEDDDIKKPYGKISDILFDNYLSNCFFQIIKREYQKLYEKDTKLKSFHEIYFQPKERKNLRIISCNHYIHFSCHFEGFMSSDYKRSINIFKCPLCQRLSETFVPMLDHYTEEQSHGVFKGFSLIDVYDFAKKNMDLFKLKTKYNKESIAGLFTLSEDKKKEAKQKYKPYNDKDNFDVAYFKKNFPEIIHACKHIFEGFVCMKLYVDYIDIEGDFYKGLISTQIIFFGIQNRDFLDFMENIEDKKTTVNLWKNFLLSMRMLCRLNILEKENYFCEFYNLLDQIKRCEFDISYDLLIKNDNIRLKICQLLFLIPMLFDYDEIEGYEKYIIYMILPIWGFGFFFKDLYIKTHFLYNKDKFLEELTDEKLLQYLKTDKSLQLTVNSIVTKLFIVKIVMSNDIDADKVKFELNEMLDVLNLPDLKNKKYFEILQNLHNDIFEGDTGIQYVSEIFKPEVDYKKVLNKIIDNHITVAEKEKCDEILNPTLFGSCYPMIYKFIDLPKTATDLEFKFYNVPCEGCKAIGKYALICLDCGRKVCDSRSCLTKVADNIEMACFFAHTKTCGGGRSAFLQSEDLSVLFVSHKVVFKKFVPLYVNNFGEGITKNRFGPEFQLSEEEVQKAQKMFTSYSYSNSPFIN